MAASRPKASMFFLVGILVCLILVKQIHAVEQTGHSIHAFHDLANDDADDSRYDHIIGNMKKFGDDDPEDDTPEVTVLGH